MNVSESNAHERYLLGGYEILETTGSGGMGVVYRAVDTALGRVAAVKVLKDGFQNHPQLIARFRREAEAIASLDHPNIVRIYAVGESGGIPFIAMEFIEGRPLSDLLEESGSMPWQDVLDLAIQVAEGLACAHGRQIIHRDIKPANILVTANGHVKVTDFGIAKILNASTQLTVDGTRIGTPQYMCPERCRDQPITASSDIYAVGVLLFQCLTGRLPFEARTAASLVSKISSEVPPRVRAFKPDVPEAVDCLVAYLLEKEARNRPADALALCDAIARVRRGEPLPRAATAGLGPALAACHEQMPVATSRSARDFESRTTKLTPGFGARLRAFWFGQSRAVRLGVAVLIAGLAAAGGALVARHTLRQTVALPAEVLARQDLSRWDDGHRVAEFRQETGQVSVGTIGLPGFFVSEMGWAPGADGAILLLRGADGSARAGQSAMLMVNPGLREVSVGVPPYGSAQPPRVLAAGVFGEMGSGFLLQENGGAYIRSVHPGRAPVPLAVGSYYTGGADSAGTMMLLASAGPNGAHRLSLLEAANPTEARDLVTFREPITGIAMHTVTQRAAILHGEGFAGSLDSLSFGLLRPEPVRLDGGAIALHPRAFNEGGSAMVYTVGVAGETATIRVRSLAPEGFSDDAGPGFQAAWEPREGYLIASAPDHAGRTQLWAVQGDAPYSRRQLTFVETGTTPFFTISEAGGTVLAGVPGEHAIVCVETGPIAW